MRNLFFMVLLALESMTVISCDKSIGNGAGEEDLSTTINKVSNSAKLYTSEIQVHKIVLFDDVTRIKGNILSTQINVKLPLGERKMAIPVDATLKSYIDFANFSKDNVKTETVDGKKKLVITLPDPQIVLTASKIDYDGMKEEVSFLRSRFSNEEITKYTKQGIDAIVKAVPKMGLLETSRESASRMLVPLFVRAGYNEEDIMVVFRKDLKEETISNLTQIKD